MGVENHSLADLFMAPWIENPNSEVRRVREEPLDKVIQEAAETFTEPQCPENRPDCYTAPYPDAFDWTRIDDFSQRVMPSAFWNSEELNHLGEGIRDLLASYYFVTWVQSKGMENHPFAGAAIPVLLSESYLGKAIHELRQANAGQGVFSRLAMLKNDLEKADTTKSQQEILLDLGNITLGYLYYFMEAYQDVSVNVHEPKEAPPAPELVPPPPVSELAPEASSTSEEIVVYVRPPPPPPPPPEEEPPPVHFREKIVRAGGLLQKLSASECTTDKLLSRLGSEQKKKHIQIVFQVDATSSDLGELLADIRFRLDEISTAVRKNLLPGGEVSMALRFRAYDNTHRLVRLDSFDTLELRSRTQKDQKGFWGTLSRFTGAKDGENEAIKAGIGKILDFMETERFDFSSNVFEVTQSALKEELWAPASQDVERILFLLTDSEAIDSPVREQSINKIMDAALEKNVRIEALVCSTDYGWWPPDDPYSGLPILVYNVDLKGARRILSYESPFNRDLRYNAMIFIRNQNRPEYAKYLHKALDPHSEIYPGNRRAAVGFLGDLGNPESIPYLRAAADPDKEPNAQARQWAANALERFGKK